MNKSTSLLILASVLILGILAVSYAAEQAVTASVSVTGAASITVSSNTLDFGSMAEGEKKNATVNPLVVTIDANTGYSVKTKANQANFTGTSNIVAGNLTWASTPGGIYNPYTTSDAVVATGSSPGTAHNMYHTLTIPVNTVSGNYNLPITISVTTP